MQNKQCGRHAAALFQMLALGAALRSVEQKNPWALFGAAWEDMPKRSPRGSLPRFEGKCGLGSPAARMRQTTPKRILRGNVNMPKGDTCQKRSPKAALASRHAGPCQKKPWVLICQNMPKEAQGALLPRFERKCG